MDYQMIILNKLSEILHFSSELQEYDKATLEYKFNPAESWESISMYHTVDLKNFPAVDFDKVKYEVIELAKKLHDNMQSQTGGDWRKFILTLDKNGNAKTEFSYEIQSCLDDINELFS